MEFIDSFTEAGISPLDTLRAMTVRAAELLGVASERGALRVGMAADLVAMPTSPLRDVNVLKHIDFVMRNGTVVRQP
jgi:imidazolonepropionase-like amidohydrolase